MKPAMDMRGIPESPGTTTTPMILTARMIHSSTTDMTMGKMRMCADKSPGITMTGKRAG